MNAHNGNCETFKRKIEEENSGSHTRRLKRVQNHCSSLLGNSE